MKQSRYWLINLFLCCAAAYVLWIFSKMAHDVQQGKLKDRFLFVQRCVEDGFEKTDCIDKWNNKRD